MTEETTQDIAEETPYWGEETNVEDTPKVELEPFDDERETQVAEATTTDNAQGDEQSRFEYWQSRYDKKASEHDALSKRLEEYNNIAPIAEYIQGNPEVLKSVARSLSGDNPSVPSQEKSNEAPQRPQRPTKPNSYDANEAVMDSDSESYKYRVAMDDYREGIVDYQEAMEVSRYNAMKAQEQQVAQQRMAYERQQAEVGMAEQLQNQYGYSPEKASEFMKYYSTPESITLDNLVSLDRLRQAPSQQEVATQQKVQAMQNSQKRMQVPTPTAVQTGQAQPNYSDEDLFNLGLMANNRK
jgi:hypothetical protein